MPCLRDTPSSLTYVDIKVSNLWNHSLMTWFKMTQLSDRTWTKLSSDSKKLCKASVSGNFDLGPAGGCCTFQTRCEFPFISFRTGKERWPTLWKGHLRYPVYRRINTPPCSSPLVLTLIIKVPYVFGIFYLCILTGSVCGHQATYIDDARHRPIGPTSIIGI